MAGVALGIFSDAKDVGTLLHPGSASFDQKSRTYTLSASGENMWGAKDAFHFLFKEARGDLAISADIAFVGAGTDKHRKACLMFRQSLEADSAYIDVAVHGDGLTSLQFRETKGGLTHEIQANVARPRWVAIEKHKNGVYLFFDSKFSGASHRIQLQEPFLVGLAVCSHNKDVMETATFANVSVSTKVKARLTTLYNTLESQSIASTDRRAVFTTTEKIESPAWTLDGTALLFTMGGQRYSISATAPAAEPLMTSISAAGLISTVDAPDGKKRVMATPSGVGSTLRLILADKSAVLADLASPAETVLPCWSPDSKKIAFISQHRLP